MTDSDSQHLTTIAWARGEWSQHKGKYSREHLWHFAGGAKLKASVLIPRMSASVSTG
jgi:hypothetical protein